MTDSKDVEAVPLQRAAELLGISLSGCYDLCRQEILPSFKIGRMRRIRLSAIEALIAQRERETTLKKRKPPRLA